jgi:hypothetical protein
MAEAGECSDKHPIKVAKKLLKVQGNLPQDKEERKALIAAKAQIVRRERRERFSTRLSSTLMTGLNYVCIKRLSGPGTITSSASADVANGSKMTLSDMPGYAEFTALFDSYRLRSWKVRFQLKMLPVTSSFWNGSAIVDSFPNINPIYMAYDPDDAATPTMTSILQRSDVRCIALGDMKQNVFDVKYPKFAVAAYNGAFTGYAAAGGWVDCGYPGIEWYGWKYVWPMNDSVGIGIAIVHECEWEFRITR